MNLRMLIFLCLLTCSTGKNKARRKRQNWIYSERFPFFQAPQSYVPFFSYNTGQNQAIPQSQGPVSYGDIATQALSAVPQRSYNSPAQDQRNGIIFGPPTTFTNAINWQLQNYQIFPTNTPLQPASQQSSYENILPTSFPSYGPFVPPSIRPTYIVQPPPISVAPPTSQPPAYALGQSYNPTYINNQPHSGFTQPAQPSSAPYVQPSAEPSIPYFEQNVFQPTSYSQNVPNFAQPSPAIPLPNSGQLNNYNPTNFIQQPAAPYFPQPPQHTAPQVPFNNAAFYGPPSSRPPGYDSNTPSNVAPVPPGTAGPGIFNCFTLYQNHILIRAAPFERRTDSTAEQCANLCITITQPQACQAIVYNNMMYTCDMYSVQAGQGYTMSYHLYGSDYYALQPQCRMGGISTASPSTATPVTSTTPGTLTTPGTVLTTTQTSTPGTGCPAGQAPVIQRVQGYMLSGSDGFVQQGISQQACVLACLSNLNTQGQSYPCLSIDYQSSTETCIMSTEAASPARSGILAKDPDSTYFEKICLSQEAASRCNGYLERVPQMVLVGFTEEVRTTSYDGCIEACLTSYKNNYLCKSALYYHSADSTSDNCVLGFDDRSAAPELFLPEDQKDVEYFEIASCGVSLRRTNVRVNNGSTTEKTTEFKSLKFTPAAANNESALPKSSYAYWENYLKKPRRRPGLIQLS